MPTSQKSFAIRKYRQSDEALLRVPRIALLTPYSGDNLGDAAIQDAIISNLRTRMPHSEFSGISLNCENFLARHGSRAFPICITERPFYGMARAHVVDHKESSSTGTIEPRSKSIISEAFRKYAILLLRRGRAIVARLDRFQLEFRHAVDGFRFLSTHDMLVVSGGGQLDEEWGGAWGHPFALLKWAVLARIARIPFVIISVGAGKTNSALSRFFIANAMRLAEYRSYRDEHSKKIVESIWSPAANDPVVPDAAFSLPISQFSLLSHIRTLSQGRTVIAISLIAFAKPGHWPRENQVLYDRYVEQMARVVAVLMERGCFVVMVSSSLGADRIVIQEVSKLLMEASNERMAFQFCAPEIANWKDVVRFLADANLLIASRLHSAILGFRLGKPAVAISFDPKIEWLMEDLGQSEYLLDIRDFRAEDVIRLVEKLELLRDKVSEQIVLYHKHAFFRQIAQYDLLAGLAIAQYRKNSRQADAVAWQ